MKKNMENKSSTYPKDYGKEVEEYHNINRDKVVKPFIWACERCNRKFAHTTPMNQINVDGKNLIVCLNCKIEAYKTGEIGEM